jgi:hypothetical protein
LIEQNGKQLSESTEMEIIRVTGMGLSPRNNQERGNIRSLLHPSVSGTFRIFKIASGNVRNERIVDWVAGRRQRHALSWKRSDR